MKLSTINLTAGAGLVALSLVLLTQVPLSTGGGFSTDDIDPMLYPRVLIFLLLGCGLVIAFLPSSSACAQGDGIPFFTWRTFASAGAIVAYSLLVNILGFMTASFLASVALAAIMGWHKWFNLLWINAVGMVVFWLLFRHVLKIVLPAGCLI